LRAFSNADLVLADGAPVALAASLNAGHAQERVCGPDLMLEACQQGLVLGWRHYIYGGKEGVAEALATKLRQAFPGLQIAGTECPPFRSLSDAEISETAQRISASGADIVWVGLGCPKQDVWMHRICPFLSGSVMVGVGAAFDFHSGSVQRAPKWMRRSGLEWLHRLASEPRRLWHRYLVLAPRFIARVLAPSIGEALRRRLALGTAR
jgi:N-acetylglucosaminyldiphosphoundecaprenol N-acetyl-beta-D-mannosaminyltransferase